MTAGELIGYIENRYGAKPEYLWADTPDCFVLRHSHNRKWFAVVLRVRRDRLGLAGDGDVDILDLKCGPILGGSHLGQPGVLPAYHMNKQHWIGVLLDGSAADDTVKELLEISYALTEGKR